MDLKNNDDITTKLHGLILYKKILQDSLMQKVLNIISLNHDNKDSNKWIQINDYADICYMLISFGEGQSIKGDLLKRYIIDLILKDENPFSIQCERIGQDIGESLRYTAICDLEILSELLKIDLDSLIIDKNKGKYGFLKNYYPSINKINDSYGFGKKYEDMADGFSNKHDEGGLIHQLIDFYHYMGSGVMNQYPAFRWDGNKELIGINEIDRAMLGDLIGIERQKKILVENTEAFINGCKANNMLLYGDNGTGKSSSIKALVNEYANRGLRVLELSKHHFVDIPKIYELLGKRGCKFIIFMDDLSFEENETEYKHLKAMVEGGIQVKPVNVLIYATSNRRHLINEKWSDRNKDGGDIHVRDTVQEKTSLADRFGITLFYESPSQKEFLRIVEALACKCNIAMPQQELSRLAIQWELSYSGRSGRTAQQFIDHLLGTIKSKEASI